MPLTSQRCHLQSKTLATRRVVIYKERPDLLKTSIIERESLGSVENTKKLLVRRIRDQGNRSWLR